MKAQDLDHAEFIYLYQMKCPRWEDRVHHPGGSGTINTKLALKIYGYRSVFIPKEQWK